MVDITAASASAPAQLYTASRGLAPELAVIVPTFNERDNVVPLVERLDKVLAGLSWELIFVDDNSPDGTAEAAWDVARTRENVRCIKRLNRRGLSSACAEGILSTNAPFVAVMDGDLQHDEAILPTMLAKVRAGADIAVGTRYSGEGSSGDGFSAVRQWGSTLATRLSALVTGQQLSDPMSGFFMVRRDLFVDVAPKLSADGFKILLDLVVTATRKGTPPAIAQVPYTFRARQAGESKMSSLVVMQFLGLWLSKLTGGVLPTSFLLFALVGFSGVAVHLTVLTVLNTVLGMHFLAAQIFATLTAMTWNFFINNTLTYSDRKLRGAKLWTGLLVFYLVCSLGGIANISIAQVIYEARPLPLIAGLAGALMSSVFNYSVTRIFTWK